MMYYIIPAKAGPASRNSKELRINTSKGVPKRKMWKLSAIMTYFAGND